ncbi:MFS transporter [Streptomyces cinereoruber]|uniref:MFS transporter n=1 Tax=Streptomyces cinereoruber TaxID=67260 RepID=UPI0036437C59
MTRLAQTNKIMWQTSGSQKGIKTLLALQLCIAWGNGMTIPLLVFYLHELRDIPLGLATSVTSIAMIVSLAGNPIGGYLADRFSARSVSSIGLMFAGIATALLGYSSNSWQIAGVIACLGFGLSISLPSQDALLAILASEQYLSTAFSFQLFLRNAGLCIGSAVGLLVMGRVDLKEIQTLYISDGFIMLLAALIILRVPESKNAKKARKEEVRLLSLLAVIGDDKRLQKVLILNFLLSAAVFSQLHSGFPAYAAEFAKHSSEVISAAYIANTVSVVALQMLILRLIRGWRHKKIIATMCFSLLVTIALVYSSAHTREFGAILFVGAAAIFAVGEILYAAAVPGMVNLIASDRSRGQYNGALVLSTTAGYLCGVTSSGFILSSGHQNLWFFALLTAILSASVTFLGAGPLRGFSAR